MRRKLAALLGATAVVWAGLAAPAYAADGVKLSVLHAVPGLTVDVYVNGERTIDNFKPGTLAGPLDLDAGTYEVAITAADADDDSDPAIGPVDLDLKAGGNYTAVAHLDEGGDPTATLFTNDTSKTDAGQGRLTVRHTAAAPAVDILAGGDAVISDLSNPDEKVLDLDAGTVEASVAAAGTTDPVIGPADVTVKEGMNTIVYAWGSLEDDNLKLAVQTISGLHSPPHGVNAGEAGLAATELGLLPGDRAAARRRRRRGRPDGAAEGGGSSLSTSVGGGELHCGSPPSPCFRHWPRAPADPEPSVAPRLTAAAVSPTPTPSKTGKPAPTSTISVPISGTEPSAAGSDRSTRPERFVLGEIDLPVTPVGVADDGMMELPSTAYAVGWYEYGARPADRAGTTVLAGHVDTKAEGLGPLAALRGVDEGSEIVVAAIDGKSRRYQVTDVKEIRKSRVPLDQVFARDGEETLVVITCGGPYSRSTGYRDNVIVTATPL